MREIKFKAWSTYKQKWYHKVIEFVLDRPKGSIGYLPSLSQVMILRQFTGLCDKNDIEIFIK